MTTEQMNDEAQLLGMIDRWREAVRRKDIEGVMADYAGDVVSFDAWGELRNPAEVYRDHWEQCFAGHDGPIAFEHHDLKLTVGEGAAFCHCLVHMTGTLKGGTKNDLWARGTICFEKRNGRWLVTPEHASIPFNPMTGQACTNLKP